MAKITSLTNLKKQIKVGALVNIDYHQVGGDYDPETDKVLFKTEKRPTRRVSRVQSNLFELATPIKGYLYHGVIKFPKAKNCKIKDGKLTILAKDVVNESEEIIPLLTIEIIG